MAVPVRPGEGPLGPRLPEHLVLLRRQLLAPLRVGLLDLRCHAIKVVPRVVLLRVRGVQRAAGGAGEAAGPRGGLVLPAALLRGGVEGGGALGGHHLDQGGVHGRLLGRGLTAPSKLRLRQAAHIGRPGRPARVHALAPPQRALPLKPRQVHVSWRAWSYASGRGRRGSSPWAWRYWRPGSSRRSTSSPGR